MAPIVYSAMEAEYRRAAQDRTKDVVQLRNPVSVYNKGGSKMQSQLNRRGNPLDQLANRSFAPNALLSNSGRNPFQTSREELVPEGQPLFNNQHVINRTIEPLEPDVDSVGRFELALLHRKDSHKLEFTRVQEMHSTQQRPVVEVNPAQFNMQICEEQIALFNNPATLAKYAGLTAQEIWEERWSIDGVVEVASGYETPGQGSTVQSLGARKRTTVISKGPQFVYNYWRNSPNMVEPGSRLWAIIKKYPKPERYVLNHRFNELTGRNGQGSTTRDSPVVTNTALMPFRPYQMSFYATRPDQKRPPMEALEQIDEWGFRSYGHAIQVGVAMHVPRQPSGFLGSAQMVHQGRDEPFTDSNVGIESSTLTMLKVVFDCDDGIMPV